MAPEVADLLMAIEFCSHVNTAIKNDKRDIHASVKNDKAAKLAGFKFRKGRKSAVFRLYVQLLQSETCGSFDNLADDVLDRCLGQIRQYATKMPFSHDPVCVVERVLSGDACITAKKSLKWQ